MSAAYPLRIALERGVVHASRAPIGRWYVTACSRSFAAHVKRLPPDTVISCLNCQRRLSRGA
jgi:hypothetical protein